LDDVDGSFSLLNSVVHERKEMPMTKEFKEHQERIEAIKELIDK
jgi:hypothetical protein